MSETYHIMSSWKPEVAIGIMGFMKLDSDDQHMYCKEGSSSDVRLATALFQLRGQRFLHGRDRAERFSRLSSLQYGTMG